MQVLAAQVIISNDLYEPFTKCLLGRVSKKM